MKIKMLHETDEINKLEIVDTSVTFNKIYQESYFPTKYDLELKQANVLIIPQAFRNYQRMVFPENTTSFLEYLRVKSNQSDIISNICIDDENYLELELHDNTINLPELLANWIVFPILTSIISSYLYDKIKERSSKKNVLKTTINITVESNGKSKRIHYEGNAENFDNAMKTVNKRLKDIL